VAKSDPTGYIGSYSGPVVVLGYEAIGNTSDAFMLPQGAFEVATKRAIELEEQFPVYSDDHIKDANMETYGHFVHWLKEGRFWYSDTLRGV